MPVAVGKPGERLLQEVDDLTAACARLREERDGWRQEVQDMQRKHAVELVSERSYQAQLVDQRDEARKLIGRAVRNAGYRTGRSGLRWGFIADTFAVGSTSAIALCNDHGHDPEEIVGHDPDCEEGRGCGCHHD
jgi:hypothetical protein